MRLFQHPLNKRLAGLLAIAATALALTHCGEQSENAQLNDIVQRNRSAPGITLKRTPRRPNDTAPLQANGFAKELGERLQAAGEEVPLLEEDLTNLSKKITKATDAAIGYLDGEGAFDGSDMLDPESLAQQWSEAYHSPSAHSIRDTLEEEGKAAFEDHWRTISINLTEMLATKEFDQWQRALDLNTEQADDFYQIIGRQWYSRLVPGAPSFTSDTVSTQMQNALSPAQWQLFQSIEAQAQSIRETLRAFSP